MQLKSNVYLELAEVKEWLKIKDDTQDAIITRLINTVCDRVEKYIDRPVLAREFTEFHDGNASNIIVPTYSPLFRVVEVRIDFNRAFDATTPINKENIVIRGIPSLKQSEQQPIVVDAPNSVVTNPIIDQLNGNFSVKLEGQDIVLRDDNNTAILGRLFSGSVLQSIMVTYVAGLAETKEQVPSDLSTATLQYIEHMWMHRENRTMNLKSKTSMQQSYSYFAPGIPKEITDVLDEYKDYNLWTANVPQKNTFTL